VSSLHIASTFESAMSTIVFESWQFVILFRPAAANIVVMLLIVDCQVLKSIDQTSNDLGIPSNDVIDQFLATTTKTSKTVSTTPIILVAREKRYMSCGSELCLLGSRRYTLGSLMVVRTSWPFDRVARFSNLVWSWKRYIFAIGARNNAEETLDVCLAFERATMFILLSSHYVSTTKQVAIFVIYLLSIYYILRISSIVLFYVLKYFFAKSFLF